MIKKKITVCIMCGGEGDRLYPLTKYKPKGLLEINCKPLIEIIIEYLKEYGLKDYRFFTNYKHEMIEEYFGNGERFGIKIKYYRENIKLGTIGGIFNARDIENDFIVINCDIISNVNIKDLLKFHYANKNVCTLVSVEYEKTLKYGVVHKKNNNLLKIEEKPNYGYEIFSGISVFTNNILSYNNKMQFKNITDLYNELIFMEENISVYKHEGFWIDIGNKEDYEYAIKILGEK